MDDDGFEAVSPVKDPRGSLRGKYNRRVQHLIHAIEQFLYIAKERLNPDVAGDIYRKAEAENVIAHAEALLGVIPARFKPTFDTPEDAEKYDEAFVNFFNTVKPLDPDESPEESA